MWHSMEIVCYRKMEIVPGGTLLSKATREVLKAR